MELRGTAHRHGNKIDHSQPWDTITTGARINRATNIDYRTVTQITEQKKYLSINDTKIKRVKNKQKNKFKPIIRIIFFLGNVRLSSNNNLVY